MRQSQDHDTVELTSDEVRTMTVETLIDHFSLVVDGHKYKTEDIWNVTVAASAQRQAIESAANQLVDAPDPSTVRYYLRNELVNLMTLIEIENDCNEALVDHLPPGMSLLKNVNPYEIRIYNHPKSLITSSKVLV
jgi:hypothetical protein